MSQGMYNGRKVRNVPPPPQGAPNSSPTEVPLNHPQWNESTIPNEYFPHQPQNITHDPYYTGPPNGPFYCSQPREQAADAWAWSNEPNNNPTALNPQAPVFNSHADPWNWSVNQSAEVPQNQWAPEQLLAQPVQQMVPSGPPYYYPPHVPDGWAYEQMQAPVYEQPTWPAWEQPSVPLVKGDNDVPNNWDPSKNTLIPEGNANMLYQTEDPDQIPHKNVSEDKGSASNPTENASVKQEVGNSGKKSLEIEEPLDYSDDFENTVGIKTVSPPEDLPDIVSQPPIVYSPSTESQVDEPNQEVPEPVGTDSPAHNYQQESTKQLDPSVIEDPPNEQVPQGTGRMSPIQPITLPTIHGDCGQVKPIVIQPWEGGPFQPPQTRQADTKGVILQQEVTDEIDTLTSDLNQLNIESQEGSANLESEPENLERPPDPESVKPNPHHLSLHRQHFSQDLDGSSPKTTLWEQPNLPNVLFVPADNSLSSLVNPIPLIPSFDDPIISSAANNTSSLNENETKTHTWRSSPVLEQPEILTKQQSPARSILSDKSDNVSVPPLVQAVEKTLDIPPVKDNIFQPDNIPLVPPVVSVPQNALSPVIVTPASGKVEPVSKIKEYQNNIPVHEPNIPDNRSSDNRTLVDKNVSVRENRESSLPLVSNRRNSKEPLPNWNDPMVPPTQHRYKEMEDIDHRKYDRHSSSRYPKDRNDRYYYEESRERNSRPSSRASEPIPDNYSGRYYNQYLPERPRGDYYSTQDAPVPPPREGTPMSDIGPKHRNNYENERPRNREGDPERVRRNEGDHDRSRREDYDRTRRGRDDYEHRKRSDYDSGRPGRDDYDTEKQRTEDYDLDRRRSVDYRVGRPDDRSTEPSRRRPEDYDSSTRRRPDDLRRSDDPRNEFRDRRSHEDDRQYVTRGREEDYYNRNSARGYKGGGAYPGYDYYRQQQDPYSMYYNYYNYPMNYNYGFYDELYKNNPKYREQMEQYRAYYAQMGYDSDRGSVHSGRSSVNEELRKDPYKVDYDSSSEYSGYQQSMNYETSSVNALDDPDPSIDTRETCLTPAVRLTPAKFSCPHPVGRITHGKLVAVLPLTSSINSCSLELHDLQQTYLLDKGYQDVKSFPGPLLSGFTHKNDVIQFCQSKIQNLQCNLHITDRESQILLWELLVLMLRQNGNVSGSDIAELLLKDRQPTKLSLPPGRTVMRQASAAGSSSSPSDDVSELPALSTTTTTDDTNHSNMLSPDEGIVVTQDSRLSGGSTGGTSSLNELSVEQITAKFTEYLLFGHKKDALEWATKHGLWGHALFLASKMDSRSYANIMTRFANSLPLNDPLQTLYQLMSGRQPSAVTRVADEKWGDWRPHLAMILSNLTQHPEVDSRSITTLGDTLAQRGCLSAAHFCYLMAQVEFGKFDNKACKLVLLTSNHLLGFEHFASNEAIQCTEIYEYAQSLANPNFFLPNLQPYKLLYASRLIDYGLLQEALHYCEAMTNLALKAPDNFSLSLLGRISQFSWKLKYQDPLYTQEQGELEDIADPIWLVSLQKMLLDSSVAIPFQNQESGYDTTPMNPPYSSESDGWASNSETTVTGYTTSQPAYTVQDQFNLLQTNVDQPSWAASSAGNVPTSMYSTTTYGQIEKRDSVDAHTDSTVDESNTSQPIFHSENQPSPNATKSFNYYGVTTQQPAPVSNRERQNSVGSYGRRDSAFSTTSMNSQVNRPTDSAKSTPALAPKKEVKAKPQAGRSWLGGIFSKFLPKGPNQMILPDDKNPTILWDSKTNKWINSDDDGSPMDVAPVAPPKDSDLGPTKSIAASMAPNSSIASSLNSSSFSSSSSPPPSGGVNRFQRPKQRSNLQNYVDVFNTSNGGRGNTNFSQSVPPPADGLFPKMESVAPPNLFVPAPSANVDSPGDFVSPAHSIDHPTSGDNSEMGSDNSLRMFDPSEFSTAPKVMGDPGHKRTLGGYLPRRAYPS